MAAFVRTSFHRLAIAIINIPPLRERHEDIEILAKLFIDKVNESRPEKISFTKEALRSLKSHSWPGNVRELENTVARASAYGLQGLS